MSDLAVHTPRFFLKIAEIKGDARPKNHDGEIELISWEWGETQEAAALPAGNSAKAGGSVAFREVVCTAVTGTASAQLLLLCASAKRLKSAILSCDRVSGPNTVTYLTITLGDNIIVSSFEIGGSPSRDLTVDRFSLRFTKIDFKYVQQKTDGSAPSNFTATWDVSQNS